MKTQDEPRPYPKNLDAERCVLGVILVNNGRLSEVAATLRPADFAARPHERIYDCILQMIAEGVPVDDVTLCERLQRVEELEAVGGVAYVSALADGAHKRANIGHYARIIREKKLLREHIRAGEAFINAAYDSKEPPADLLARHQLVIAQLADEQNDSGEIFDSPAEFDAAPEPTFSIENFLQDYAVNAVAGLPDHGKTWIALSIAKALLFGPGKLWNLFSVTGRVSKVIYLIPESSRPAIKRRLLAMGLYDAVREERLILRTLTKGPALPLNDARILHAAKDAIVIVDTAIRFMKAVDENSAAEAAQGLSNDFFALLRSGTKALLALFHSPKSFEKESFMTLENTVRGSGEFGAVLASAWGARMIEKDTATIHIENIKSRDYQAAYPFQLAGRPFIDSTGDFGLHQSNCAPLAEYVKARHHGGGAPEAVSEARAAKLELLHGWLLKEPRLSSADLAEKFKAMKIDVSDSTIRHYRKELNL